VIISRIERQALYDAYLAIDGSTFPGDIPGLCYQLGAALTISQSPSIADVDSSVAQLEASVRGLDNACVQVGSAADDLRAAWSGEAAETGRGVLGRIGDDLVELAGGVRNEIAVGMADLRETAKLSATAVDDARTRMIRAFSVTPQLRRYLPGGPGAARYATLFALVKTEAKQGVYAVVCAYEDFDQASLRFIDHARLAVKALSGEHR
jgi:hypothetical protein